MTPAELDELTYHLRELHADLTSIRAELETAGSTVIERSVIRAWIFAEALLAHDLEVHLPGALALLGATLPDEAFQGPRTGDGVSRSMVACEARRLISVVLEALSAISDPTSAGPTLKEAASGVQAAHKLVAAMQELVVSSEQPP